MHFGGWVVVRMDYQEGLRQVSDANSKIVEANGEVADVIVSVYIYHWNWYLALFLIIVPGVIW
jgi:hypothetical protein